MAIAINVGQQQPTGIKVGDVEFIRGDDGFSPIIETEEITGGTRLIITDAEGTKQVDVMDGAPGRDGVDGQDGAPGRDGVDGQDGAPGQDGADGAPGRDGVDGASAGFGTPTATVDANVGTPSVEITASGPDTAKVFNFAFHNLKGKSAYQAAVEAGFTGMEAEFNEYLSGIGDLSDEVTQQKSAIDDLSALVDRKAGALVDTASGAIASFMPDATIDNLLGVSVDIEPVQDLHGQESPYPAGGGKNKFPLTIDLHDSVYTTIYRLNDYPVLSDLFAFLNANIGSSVIWSAAVTGTPSGIAIGSLSVVSSGGTFRIAPNESATIPNYDYSTATYIVIYGSENGSTIKECQLELGTVKTSFSPYSNLCPISGWDSVEVTTAGYNLFDPTTRTTGAFIKAAGSGSPPVGDVVTYTGWDCSGYIPVKPSTRYTQTLPVFAPAGIAGLVFYSTPNVSGTISGVTANEQGSNTYTFVTPSNCHFIRFSWSNNYTEDSVDYKWPQIEEGSQTAYKPYSGNTYTIALGQTVYGGTLDVTAGTLTVDRAMVDLGTLAWTKQTDSGGYFNATIQDLEPLSGWAATLNAICSQYRPVTGNDFVNSQADKAFSGQVNYHVLRLRDSSYADGTAAEFKSAMSGVQLVYELATPITIQLDPVTISTISGQTNNVWADAGDVSVEYAADLKTYIDQKIAAAVAALS